MNQNFFGSVFGEIGGVSRSGWMLLLLLALVSAATEIVHWYLGPDLTVFDYIGTALTVPLGLIAGYVAAMAMTSRRVSPRGCLKFVAVTLILLLPIILGFAGILLLLPSSNKNAILTVTLSLVVLGWILLTMLPALPVAQALSTSFVTPLRVFRATKRHRWSLLLSSFLTGTFSKLVPATSTANNAAEAGLLAAGNGAATVAATLVATGIAVTAWRYAIKNDKALYGDEPRAAGV